MSLLAVNQLTFKHDKNSAPIINIDEFSLENNQNIFLYGSSGSGKSTFLNLISGLYVPDSGNIQIMDKPFSKLNERSRDKIRAIHMGIIFQTFNLIPYLSLMDNILLPPKMHKKHDLKIFQQRANELVASLGLQEFISKPVNRLSLGQAQRVAAARALILSPEIIIADEPTSSLDEENSANFMKLLLKESEKSKSSIIFVSHDKRLATFFDKEINLSEINKIEELT